ncbi:hypothetical protein [Pendulispora albinea]|uniref:Uncharacterized protein n=1 Tax=Pendulispora albinea TaxID=2741071 RepID=A0ABZ2LRI9_9BACT
MATAIGIRTPWAAWIGVVVLASVGVGCSESQSAPPRTAVSQQALTSAEVTSVQMKLPTGYGDVNAPPTVSTPLQKQVEDDLKYPTPSSETASEWSARYPFPAKMLAEWMEHHPQSAQRLLRWEYEQPDHVRMLVRWAIAHPYEGLGEFMMNRRGWDDFRAIRDADPEALESLVGWCRAAPRAADELVTRSEGLGPAIALRGAGPRW